MPTFLFWNLGRRPLAHRLARLVESQGIDVLLLAECAVPAAELIGTLAEEGLGRFHQVLIQPSKVLVYSRLAPLVVTEIYTHESERFAGYLLRHPSIPEDLLLATAHLRSAAHESRGSLDRSATQWPPRLRTLEAELGHRRTILVGDLNSNPFDEGITSAYGFHAVMTQAKALERLIASWTERLSRSSTIRCGVSSATPRRDHPVPITSQAPTR